MTAAKANEVGRRFPHRDKLPPVVLVFGPDRGLVTEVSDAILALFDDSDDPFAIVKLDAATVTKLLRNLFMLGASSTFARKFTWLLFNRSSCLGSSVLSLFPDR